MFSYELPKWKYQFNKKHLSILFTAIYVLLTIPMLILGFYDFPSADDFSMALETHQAYVQTGSVLTAIVASLQKAWLVYSQYEGYFFSIILTNVCPSAFSEGLYFLTPFIILGMLTFGVLYFFNALFVRMWKLDKDFTNVVTMSVLILMVHSLPKNGPRVEAFYWYSGAINYTFTFGMAFFWLGLLLRAVYDEDIKARKRKLIWACFWGFWMGGSNYLTALELAIISVLILFICFMVKREVFKLSGGTDKNAFVRVWIPAVFNLIGFACSCFTPGNLVRSAETEHVGAVKSVFLSIYSTFDMMINDMSRWELWVALVMLVPVFWTMAGSLKARFQHPFMFVLFSFLLVSSNMVPPFFAVGNIGAGRLKALGWMEYVVMVVLTLFYLTAWARQHLEEKNNSDVESSNMMLSKAASFVIAVSLGFVVFGSALSVIPDHDYYSGTSALFAIADGSAATYKAENDERLKTLRNYSIKDAELLEYSVHPDMLFYWDVTPDKSEWINTATAKYYDKDSVILINR
ncbi:MAG: hypothetical protein J5959_14820, partial [Butyrivibrio sp.]|nr:hypothetical protein [Butyrivibrio sp.]